MGIYLQTKDERMADYEKWNKIMWISGCFAAILITVVCLLASLNPIWHIMSNVWADTINIVSTIIICWGALISVYASNERWDAMWDLQHNNVSDADENKKAGDNVKKESS